MLAYVLITLNINKEQEVLDKLKELSNIKEAHIVFGEWDIIALAEVESPEHLSKFIIDNVRVLPEVELTSTMVVAK